MRPTPKHGVSRAWCVSSDEFRSWQACLLKRGFMGVATQLVQAARGGTLVKQSPTVPQACGGEVGDGVLLVHFLMFLGGRAERMSDAQCKVAREAYV